MLSAEEEKNEVTYMPAKLCRIQQGVLNNYITLITSLSSICSLIAMQTFFLQMRQERYEYDTMSILSYLYTYVWLL